MNSQDLLELAGQKKLVGLFAGIKNKDYHDGPGHSNSGLGHVLQSPRHYQIYLRNRPGQTKPMFEGDCFHTLLLQPERVAGEWLQIEAGINYGTKAYEALAAKNPGKTLVSEDLWAKLSKMVATVMENDLVQKFMTGHKELTGYAYCPRTGLLRKCRPDVYHEELRMTIDFKTTIDASASEFARSVNNFGYHIQGAYHMDTLNLAIRQETKRKRGVDPGDIVDNHVIVAVEHTEPHGVGLFALGYAEIELGRSKYEIALDTLSESMLTPADKPWKLYPTEIQTLNLPGWAFYQ